MKNTKLAKTLAILVCSLLLTQSLASCSNANSDNNGENTTNPLAETTTQAIETANPNDENGYLLDNIPSDTNYNKQAFNILFTEAQMSKTYTKDLNADIVNDANYYRLEAIENRIGVELNFIGIPGSWNERAAFIQNVQRSINAGGGEYDLIAAYNLIPPTMAVQGMLEDLNALDYPQFDKPWWPQNLLAQSMIDNKLFFAADTSSWNTIRNMIVVTYNKQLVSDYGITGVEQLVLDGKWTIDKLVELTKDTYKDVNNNGSRDTEDQFGLATDVGPRLDGYFFGSGLDIAPLNNTGVPAFKLGDEKIIDYVKKLADMYHNNNNIIIDSSQYKMFKDQRALFYQTAVAIADQKLEFEYGVLPMPKWDTTQEDYITALSNTHDIWCVPTGAKNPALSGLVLEAFASEAYRKVAPAYYEQALKVKYTTSSTQGQVYDLIRAAITFDFGYVYGNNFTKAPFILVRDTILQNTPDWASIWTSNKSVYEKELETMITALKLAGE